MSDFKPHVVIDEQKNIILPEELKNHMVQFDHNVKTLTFDCPRYSDGRDLSTMRIYVNYFRKSGEKDADACQNIKVDSKDTNLIHFEWVPKRSATLEAGVLAFLICAEKEDTEGNQENAWHTKLCKDLKIAEGMDCLKAVIEKYPTIITYLLTRMEDVESIATPEAMQTYVNQYLLENPPSGMTDEERALLEENIALTKQIQEDLAAVDQSKADAIICTSEGSTIVATDSAEAGFEGLHLFGRSEQVTTTGAQLLKYRDSETNIIEVDDGKVKINGTTTSGEYVNYIAYLAAGTYFFSLLGRETVGDYGARLSVVLCASDGTQISDISLSKKTGLEYAIETEGEYIFRVYVQSGNTFSNVIFYPMLNSGTEALPWEPYTGGKPSPSVDYPQEIVSVGQMLTTGDQLANLPDVEETELSGIKWSCKNGIVHAKGTATHTSPTQTIGIKYAIPIVAGRYFISGTMNSVGVFVLVRDSSENVTYYSEKSFVLDGTEKVATVYCQVNAGNIVDEFVFPMLNFGTKALPWEPYSEKIAAVADAGINMGLYSGNLLREYVLANAKNRVLSTVRLRVAPNTEYTFSTNIPFTYGGEKSAYVFGYNTADTAASARNGVWDGQSRIITTLDDGIIVVAYRMDSDNVSDLTKYWFMLNAGPEALPYEPYIEKQTLTSLTPNGLLGIKVTDASLATYTDADGQMWCADEKDYERGVYVQRVVKKTIPANGFKLEGSNLTAESYNMFAFDVASNYDTTTYTARILPCLCNKFIYGEKQVGTCVARTTGDNGWAGAARVYIYVDKSITTIDEFMTLVGDDLTVFLPLATPIETPLSAEEIAAYKALHTNKPTTTVMNSENVHMKVDYVADTKNHIAQNYVPVSKYTALEERVAAIEELVIS